MFLRLFWRAPRTTIDFAARRPARRGTAMLFLPLRYWPVSDLPSCRILFKRPFGDDRAAVHAGPGPISRMWSAARIVSASCSTTITVLPRSRSR